MEMSIPYRIRTQISSDGHIRADTKRYRKDTAIIVPTKRSGDYRGIYVSGSCAHAIKYSAKV